MGILQKKDKTSWTCSTYLILEIQHIRLLALALQYREELWRGAQVPCLQTAPLTRQVSFDYRTNKK